MKKHVKKLTLHRETLRTLGGDLRGVAGGGTFDTSCRCEVATGCDCPTNSPDCYPATGCFASCSCVTAVC
jgi:hypothetical protein